MSKFPQLSVVMTAACERGMRQASVEFARHVIAQLKQEGALSVSVQTALELFDFDNVSVVSRRQAASKKRESSKKRGESKSTKSAKRTKKPTIVLPFCGVVQDDWCNAVKLNHGLHTQCTQGKAAGSAYCKTCLKHADNSATGLPPYGDINERAKFSTDYRDPKGKLTTPYANVMKRLKISLPAAKAAAAVLGWEIPAAQLAERTTKRGRPAKSAAVSDTDSDGEAKSAGQKDQIAALVAQAATQVMAAPAKKVSKPKAKKVIKIKKKSVKGPSKKQQKVAATRTNLMQQLRALGKDSSSIYQMYIKGLSFDAEGNAKLRATIKDIKDKQKAAKKEAAEKVRAEKKAVAAQARAEKKQAAAKEKLLQQLKFLGTHIMDPEKRSVEDLKQRLKEKKATIAAEKKAFKKVEAEKAKYDILVQEYNALPGASIPPVGLAEIRKAIRALKKAQPVTPQVELVEEPVDSIITSTFSVYGGGESKGPQSAMKQAFGLDEAADTLPEFLQVDSSPAGAVSVGSKEAPFAIMNTDDVETDEEVEEEEQAIELSPDMKFMHEGVEYYKVGDPNGSDNEIVFTLEGEAIGCWDGGNSCIVACEFEE